MNKHLRALWFLFAGISAGVCAEPGASSGPPQPEICTQGPGQAAAINAESRSAMAVNMFGRPETGWAFYEPLIANAIGTNCGGATPGFSKALSTWQSAHHIPITGLVDPATLGTLKQLWQQRRPFVMESQHACPDPPDEQTLAQATPSESYGGKTIELRADALAAYRKMIQAARKAGLLPTGSNLGAIFSAYRSPDSDAARCAMQNNCQGVVRASCSAHRTGFAMDINLGAAPGSRPDSSDDPNRLFISQTPFYRWLVKNAVRFGLVNYAFEPWHWEYIGNLTP
jgi:D-alanyl-D-alanine carboxypeptidase